MTKLKKWVESSKNFTELNNRIILSTVDKIFSSEYELYTKNKKDLSKMIKILNSFPDFVFKNIENYWQIYSKIRLN